MFSWWHGFFLIQNAVEHFYLQKFSLSLLGLKLILYCWLLQLFKPNSEQCQWMYPPGKSEWLKVLYSSFSLKHTALPQLSASKYQMRSKYGSILYFQNVKRNSRFSSRFILYTSWIKKRDAHNSHYSTVTFGIHTTFLYLCSFIFRTSILRNVLS